MFLITLFPYLFVELMRKWEREKGKEKKKKRRKGRELFKLFLAQYEVFAEQGQAHLLELRTALDFSKFRPFLYFNLFIFFPQNMKMEI